MEQDIYLVCQDIVPTLDTVPSRGRRDTAAYQHNLIRYHEIIESHY